MTVILSQSNTLNQPTIYRLSNHLTIVAEQIPIEAVNLNLWLNVGSSQEPDDINGMAHFLEHMVFKGTPQLASGEFERRIEERGAITNAATSQEYTHYYITSAPKDFAELAPLQLEVVLNPSIPDDAFERERSVVLEEIRRADDNPRRRTYYRAMQTCFETLPYRRPVLGPSDVIEHLRPQQMRDFHHQWYQPQSMIAAVVGNLPVDTLIDTVAEGFCQIRPTTRSSPNGHRQFAAMAEPLPKITPEDPFQHIVRHDYTDASLQQARLVMMWRVPGMQQLTENYRLDVLAAILGQGKVSRLFRDLREDQELVHSIGVSNITMGIQGVFYISAKLPVDNLTTVEAVIAEHIRRIQSEPVSVTELERVQIQVTNRFIFSNERPSDRANLYGYYLSQFGNLAPALQYPENIRSLTVEELQTAAQQYLAADAYGVVTMTPS